MSFKFTPTEIPEVVLVEATELTDNRGYFSEIYRESEFTRFGIGPFVQQNLSVSHCSVIRGLHYQAAPMEVGKLVTCLQGQIFDVAVDIRKGSPTFGRWVGKLLDKPSMSLWVPPGFAHGFCVIPYTQEAIVMYRQTQYYSKEHDRSLYYNDPDIGIQWPVKDRHPTWKVSEKDARAPLLKDI